MYVSPTEAYVQSNRSYALPCSAVKAGESVQVVFWLKGNSPNPAKRQIIVRHAFPDDGANFEESPKYQLLQGYGITIHHVSRGDSDRYWCKIALESSSDFVESFVDITVLGRLVPPVFHWRENIINLS